MIKKDFIEVLKKNSQKITEDCDYLGLWIRDEKWFDCLFDLWLYWDYSINASNTPYKNLNIIYKELENIQVVRSKNQFWSIFNFTCYISDLWSEIPLFQIQTFSEDTRKQGKRKDFWEVSIYSSFYRLKEISRIDWDFFNVLWIDLKKLYIKRYDLRFDCWGWKYNNIPSLEIFIPKGKIWRFTMYNNVWGNSKEDFGDWESFEKRQKKGFWLWFNWIEYWYISNGKNKDWKTKPKKNDCWHLRIYEKVSDTIEKGKDLLYTDYINYEKQTNTNIWRVEIEFWRRFCTARGEILFEDIEELEKQINEFIWRKEKTWRFYKRYEMVWDLSLLSEGKKYQYIIWSLSRVERLLKIGYNILFWLKERIGFQRLKIELKKFLDCLSKEEKQEIKELFEENKEDKKTVE